MAPTVVSHELYDRLGRVVAEYREMPGLALTVSQAAVCGAFDHPTPTGFSGSWPQPDFSAGPRLART